MMSRTVGRAAVLAACAAAAGTPVAAQGVWTDWTSSTGTAATGTMTFAGPQAVTVGYTGEILGTQTSCGTDYWLPDATYDAPGIGAPGGSAAIQCDIIRLVGGTAGVNTISFSQPVMNPFFAIVSLGAGNSITYNFNAPFQLVSSGGGAFGGGTLTAEAGNVLRGTEGNGTIQFQGTYSSISWTVPQAENWHGFTVGAAGIGTSTVPEPASITLLGIGLVGIAAVARRRARTPGA